MEDNIHIIREAECAKITGLGRSCRYKLEKAGKFPKRRMLTKKAIGWVSTEIEAWIKHQNATPWVNVAEKEG